MDKNKDIDLGEAIRVAIDAAEREDYEGALRLFREIYGRPELEAPPDGLSHYGLCVAVAEKQTNKGVQLCEDAIKSQFYDSSHHLNLVKIHLKKGSRRRAIRALTRGLKRVPGDSELEELRVEIGHRSGGVIPFLDRDNWLNKRLGPIRRGRKRKTAAVEDKPPSPRLDSSSLGDSTAARVVIAILAFAIIFGITFLTLYQRAYG